MPPSGHALPAAHVQFFCTGGPPDAGTLAVLSPEEQVRASRFHFDRDRHRWTNGRAWIRRTLGNYLGLDPASLRIMAEPGGRPYLPDICGFDFNLSHTGDWIALAICQDGRIGVDLETIDPTFPAREIAREFFLPEECQWIANGPVDRFFQLWTAKEALMKATGRGLSLTPDRIRVSIRDGHPATVTNLETDETFPVTTWPGPRGTIAAAVLT